MVKDVTRGATLEVMVSRMKTMQSYRMAEDPHSKTCMRFVAVSATIPNLQDVRRVNIGRVEGWMDGWRQTKMNYR